MADLAIAGVPAGKTLPRVPVLALGISLSFFLALSYVLCVVFLFLFPNAPVSHSFLGLFIPWFTPLGWYELLRGLIEAIVFGWYIALVFGPLHNYVVSRFER